MVRAEITPVTDDCYDHPDEEFVRRCLYSFISLLLLLDGHLVFFSLSLRYHFAYYIMYYAPDLHASRQPFPNQI